MPTPTLDIQVGQVLLLAPVWRSKHGLVVTQAQSTGGFDQMPRGPGSRGVGNPWPTAHLLRLGFPGPPLALVWLLSVFLEPPEKLPVNSPSALRGGRDCN